MGVRKEEENVSLRCEAHAERGQRRYVVAFLSAQLRTPSAAERGRDGWDARFLPVRLLSALSPGFDHLEACQKLEVGA